MISSPGFCQICLRQLVDDLAATLQLTRSDLNVVRVLGTIVPIPLLDTSGGYFHHSAHRQRVCFAAKLLLFT